MIDAISHKKTMFDVPFNLHMQTWAGGERRSGSETGNMKDATQGDKETEGFWYLAIPLGLGLDAGITGAYTPSDNTTWGG